jgi:hypothetical protein
MLDEKSLRSPTYQASSVPVVMADKQAWMIPTPLSTAAPRFGAEYEDRDNPQRTPGIPGVWFPKKRKLEIEWSLTYDPEVQPLVDAAEQALATLSGDKPLELPEVVEPMIRMAVGLIGVNYEGIPDEAWPEIVRYSMDGSDAPTWTAVLSVVRGQVFPTREPAPEPAVEPTPEPEPAPAEA